MITSLVFGDLFEYNNKTYIFLVKTESVFYAAEILNLGLSKAIDKAYQRAMAQNRRIDQNILFCYVKLQTKDFKERLAFLGGTGKDRDINYHDLFRKLSIVLRKKDLKQICDEIVRDKSPLPIELKELVKELDM